MGVKVGAETASDFICNAQFAVLGVIISMAINQTRTMLLNEIKLLK